MSLHQLDAFLAHAEKDPELARRLHDHAQPLDLEAFLALARQAGFRWIPEAKQWQRRCSESEINALSFPTLAIDPPAARQEPSQPLPC